jgi:hypothetical protein
VPARPADVAVPAGWVVRAAPAGWAVPAVPAVPEALAPPGGGAVGVPVCAKDCTVINAPARKAAKVAKQLEYAMIIPSGFSRMPRRGNQGANGAPIRLV